MAAMDGAWRVRVRASCERPSMLSGTSRVMPGGLSRTAALDGRRWRTPSQPTRNGRPNEIVHQAVHRRRIARRRDRHRRCRRRLGAELRRAEVTLPRPRPIRRTRRIDTDAAEHAGRFGAGRWSSRSRRRRPDELPEHGRRHADAVVDPVVGPCIGAERRDLIARSGPGLPPGLERAELVAVGVGEDRPADAVVGSAQHRRTAVDERRRHRPRRRPNGSGSSPAAHRRPGRTS